MVVIVSIWLETNGPPCAHGTGVNIGHPIDVILIIEPELVRVEKSTWDVWGKTRVSTTEKYLRTVQIWRSTGGAIPGRSHTNVNCFLTRPPKAQNWPHIWKYTAGSTTKSTNAGSVECLSLSPTLWRNTWGSVSSNWIIPNNISYEFLKTFCLTLKVFLKKNSLLF